jgi:hypothetical protein
MTTTTTTELPIGTPVCYWTGVREGEGKRSRTRSTVQPLGGEGGTPVVWVEGEGSCISMTHIQVVTPKRIQRWRTKGWRMPPFTRYVGRPGKYGNPYRAINGTVYGPAGGPLVGGELVAYSTHSSAEDAAREAVEKYRRDIDCPARSSLTTEQIRADLAAWDLSCWCSEGVPCHVGVLLEVANGAS